jgi:hypothetical protein
MQPLVAGVSPSERKKGCCVWEGGGLEREAASEWTHVAQCWVYACLPLP